LIPCIAAGIAGNHLIERGGAVQDELHVKERALKGRLEHNKTLGQEGKDTALPAKKGKKQMLLRLAPELWDEIAAWAEDDFRSINGQVEYLLTECVRHRKKR
jgi:hypothetical protein